MFGVLFVLYMDARAGERALFAGSQEHLDLTIGLVNTVLLLASSWLVFQAVTAFRSGGMAQPRRLWGSPPCAGSPASVARSLSTAPGFMLE